MGSIYRETTPLSEKDCFMIFSRIKNEFTFPVHVHAEFELNFVENGAGAKRVVGDSIEIIEDLDLALIAGSNLEHGWLNHHCESKEIKEITIQFHSDLMDIHLLQKNQFKSVKQMFEKAASGITFSKETILKIKDRLYSLASEPEGAHSVFKLFGILYDLSRSNSIRELSSRAFNKNMHNYDSRRIESAYNYMLENYEKDINLPEVAKLIGLTETAFCRFFKQKTGRTFVESLIDIRINHAVRMLVDSTYNVSQICHLCGFNNLSNFNRIFKKRKGCTPSEFRNGNIEAKFFL
ncbi:AraC family transcriptional regulator [Dysgonomonas sp. 520]|uniref:AraC family transcriptional regulator n=1 Tax=Dysgonomonas sp. 520 TaxID=2302931 RepID=UPI0013D4F975|nr:AraC family transcriptional regulator [Dysgonomonas sp. 520]NDW11130.1 AraC family transcriptional regulator [Dysgonomonas sp. 520]